MAPRSASGGRSAAVASSSNAQASTSKSTISPLMELNLLQHINGIRQVPNFVAFDIFAQSTGADWMEGMLAQAKDIRRQWSTEYIASSRDQRGAQAARIAGEMLKTPSRKRAANARAQGRAVSRKIPKEIAPDPFNAAENKENAAIQPSKASAPAEPAADASSHSVGAARGTRSRADKAQIAKLPNPFQTKLLQTKAKAEQSREAIEPASTALAEPEATHEVEEAAAPAEAGPEPQVKSKEKAKAPAKLTKKQLAEQKKKEVAAASKASANEKESDESPPTATSAKGKGKAKAKAKAVEAEVVLEPAAAAEAAPLPSPPPSPVPDDESMQVDMTFAEGAMTEQPRASTPTGKKASGKLLDRMLADEGIAPIQDDDEQDSDESYSSAEEDKDAPPAESVTKTIEMTQSTRDGTSGSLLSSYNSGSSEGVTTAAPTPAPPKQKRTLASFGGSKKSLGYGLQSHNSSTPANAGFKSSFLNKSLRKAQSTRSSGSNGAEGEEEDSDEDDSMVGTKANTEANAAAMLGVKASSQTDGARPPPPKPSAAAALPERSSGSKRKSEEMEQHRDGAPAPKLARTLSDRSEKDVTQASGFAKATNASSSKAQPAKLPTTSNLLRTKLESARLQKSTNTSVVGLGARGLSSPILGRAAAPAFTAPPEAAAASSPAASAATGPRSSGPSVASLRGQWEAKAQPTRTSPRKSNTSQSQSKPPAASTTPLNSPVKETRKAAPATNVASSAGPASTTEQTQETALVNEDDAVEAQLGIASLTSKNDIPASPKLSQMVADEDDDETSLLNDDEGDADDESDDRDEDGKTTKVMRPLSAAAQTTHSQSRVASSDGTSVQNTKSAIYFSGNNDSGDTYGDDDEFTLEELEGKKTTGGASTTSSAASTAVIKPATISAPAANAAKVGEGAPGASQWGHKLKSLFNINGAALPGVIGASGPTPGTGFQPKTSRTLSGSVSAQKDATTSAAPREVHAAPALGASTLGGGVGKPASVIRADQLRRKEAEEAERRLKEQEEKRKQAIANRAAAQKAKIEEEREKEKKKRSREEEERTSKASSFQVQRPGQQQQGVGSTLGQPAKARLMGQYGGASTTGGPAPSAKLKSSVAATNANGSTNGASGDADGKKRRLSKERDEGPPPRQQTTSTLHGASKALGAPSSIRPISSVSSSAAQNGPPRPLKPAMNGPTRPQQQHQTQQAGPPRPGIAHQNSNFSQQNPFQQSQRPGGAGHSQQPPRPAVSAQQQQHRAQPLPPSPLPQADDDDLSLPSIVSEYSDSEDEATQARRARAAVWTKGDALQQALAAQQEVDADLIFGIPQGTVDLETLMPPESTAARARIGRPRSSSANWSGADGLKQWEIDSYNERMNIGGPGYQLPSRSGPAAGAAAAAPNGRLGPNGQDARRTVLALGAAAAARHQQQQQGSHRP